MWGVTMNGFCRVTMLIEAGRLGGVERQSIRRVVDGSSVEHWYSSPQKTLRIPNQWFRLLDDKANENWQVHHCPGGEGAAERG